MSLDETPTASIAELARVNQPRVLLATISTIADESVQRQIRRLPIRTICLDEVQVVSLSMSIITKSSKVANSDSKAGVASCPFGTYISYPRWRSKSL